MPATSGTPDTFPKARFEMLNSKWPESAIVARTLHDGFWQRIIWASSPRGRGAEEKLEVVVKVRQKRFFPGGAPPPISLFNSSFQFVVMCLPSAVPAPLGGNHPESSPAFQNTIGSRGSLSYKSPPHRSLAAMNVRHHRTSHLYPLGCRSSV